MLSLVVGVLMIVGGLFWIVIVYLGVMMSSRQINAWDEMVRPMLVGLIPVALGVVLVVFGT